MALKGGYEKKKRGGKYTTILTVGLTAKDDEIIEWLARFLSTSKSDAMRTAVRSFAAQMTALDRGIGRRESGERSRTNNEGS